ncbi:MAG: O-antigen ligase family protein [Gaiellaceae bacterium]
MAGLGWADGGYFPSEWGLATLAFALIAATVLLVADAPRPERLQLGFLAGLAGLAVWAGVSTLWSSGAAAPVLEAERGLLYVAAAAAAMLLLSLGDHVQALLGGVVAGAVVGSLYALATRLFPGDVGGAYDPSSGYQLAEPIGYWNALGLLAAIAILLAAGFAAHGERIAIRAPAASALVVLLPTLYFTFSRGALVALVAGAALQVLVDPRRVRLLVSGLVLGAPAAVGVLYASRFHALTTPGDSLTTAQREGRDVATMLVALALAAAAAAVALHLAERRARLPARAGSVLLIATVLVAALVAGGAIVAAGGPVAAVERATDSFREPLPAGEGDLERRLLSASGNGRGEYWRVAADMVRDEPLLGRGAGSFEANWVLERRVSFHAHDAHNLYLETLAELGPLGLALLVGTLALPLLALPQVRRRPLAPAAAGAFAAYLLHAAVDWDWELPVVTVPAILCGAALLAPSGFDEDAWLTGRRRVVALALVVPVLAVALVAHVGNRAAAASVAAIENGEPERALEQAQRAIDWAPWSYEPWQLRGEAEFDLEDDAAARASFERALELDRESWSTWYDLAVASTGAERERALERAKALNPLSPEVEELQTER